MALRSVNGCLRTSPLLCIKISKVRAVAAASLTRLCEASNCATPSESSQTTSASKWPSLEFARRSQQSRVSAFRTRPSRTWKRRARLAAYRVSYATTCRRYSVGAKKKKGCQPPTVSSPLTHYTHIRAADCTAMPSRSVRRIPNTTNRKEVLECSGHRLSQPPSPKVGGGVVVNHRGGPLISERCQRSLGLPPGFSLGRRRGLGGLFPLERAINRTLRNLTLIQVFDGPERYGASSFFETIPSKANMSVRSRKSAKGE
jgi:hypothetical protein